MFTFPVAHFGGELSFTIAQSLRFNDNDSAFLNRTFGSAGNRKTYTFSGWFKRGNILGANTTLALAVEAGGNNADIHIESGEVLRFRDQGNSLNLITNQVFRDPGAWFHLVAAVDTTQSTASNRAKLYLNGSQITSFSTETYMAQDSEGLINSADNVEIGRNPNGSVFWDGYMAQIAFVDGQALGPTSFGETDSDTGQWKPIDITGLTFGSNGYLLQGQDSSALGDDTSGNGNDFTSSGLAAADQVSDSPTDNFATWNPLIPLSNGSFADGNLEFTQSGGSISQHAKSTISFSFGEKKVCEMQTVSGSSITLGICDEDFEADNNGFTGDSRGYFDTNGNKVDSAGNSSSYGASFGTSNVIRIEVDLSSDPGTIEIFKDGVSQGDAFTDIDSTKTWFFWCRCKADAVKANFGQLGFAGTPTTGFTALSTSNIPDPAVANPANYFDTKLWTGNDTDGRAITGYNFAPSWVWIKSRSGAYSHSITDAVRGAGPYIQSNTADAEASGPGAFGSTLAFTSDGFTLDNGTSDNLYVNAGSETYVGWAWKANGAGSSNTDGSVTSTVSNEGTANFSVVKYSGTGSGNSTVGHGLGTTPTFIICKHLDRSQNWRVFCGAVGAGETGFLNSTAAFSADPDRISAVSSTTFTAAANMNESADYIAYCFADVPGYLATGVYSGNSNADGPFVHTGFKVQWLLVKCTNASSTRWLMHDTTRNTPQGANVTNTQLFAELHNAESVDTPYDFLSNGFKPRRSDGNNNLSGRNYMYLAFAESPFKTATAR